MTRLNSGDDLTTLMGGMAFLATQRNISAARVNAYAEEMANGNWQWLPPDPRNPILLDKAGNIMSGHHRLVAAQVAGITVPKAAVARFPGTTARPTRLWKDVVVTE